MLDLDYDLSMLRVKPIEGYLRGRPRNFRTEPYDLEHRNVYLRNELDNENNMKVGSLLWWQDDRHEMETEGMNRFPPTIIRHPYGNEFPFAFWDRYIDVYWSPNRRAYLYKNQNNLLFNSAYPSFVQYAQLPDFTPLRHQIFETFWERHLTVELEMARVNLARQKGVDLVFKPREDGPISKTSGDTR